MATEIKQTDQTLIFDLQDFAQIGEEKKLLLCVNENTYHVILNLFQFYGDWLNRYTPDKSLAVWYKPEDDQASFVGDMYDKGMEELTMPGCFDELVEAQNNVARSIMVLICAMTGQVYDPEFHYHLDQVLSLPWDFQSSGLANRIGAMVQATEPGTIQETLERLIETTTIGLDAVEDILGGSHEPEGGGE